MELTHFIKSNSANIFTYFFRLFPHMVRGHNLTTFVRHGASGGKFVAFFLILQLQAYESLCFQNHYPNALFFFYKNVRWLQK